MVTKLLISFNIVIVLSFLYLAYDAGWIAGSVGKNDQELSCPEQQACDCSASGPNEQVREDVGGMNSDEFVRGGGVGSASNGNEKDDGSPSTPSVAICAVLKDEAPFLLEWIAYHWLIGVRHFFLFDHWSKDNPNQVLDLLVEAGLVHHFLVPHGLDKAFPDYLDHPHQGWAYSQCARDLGPSMGYDWMLNIDLDEFLVVAPVDDDGQFTFDAVTEPENDVREAEQRQPLRDRLLRLLASPEFLKDVIAGGVDISSFTFGLQELVPVSGPTVASFVRRETLKQYNDVKCMLRVGHEKALGVHYCETESEWPTVMVNGQTAEVDPDLEPVRRGPSWLAPLAVFHYRIRSAEACAFKAVREPVNEYKSFTAVSNCRALTDFDGQYSVDFDYRLAVHTDLIMRTARCLHPPAWHARFAAVVPDLARQHINETCPDSMFSVPFADTPRWQDRDWRSGNWILYERRMAMAVFDGAPAGKEFPPPILPNYTELLLHEPFHLNPTYTKFASFPLDKEFWHSVANETTLLAVYHRLLQLILPQ